MNQIRESSHDQTTATGSRLIDALSSPEVSCRGVGERLAGWAARRCDGRVRRNDNE